MISRGHGYPMGIAPRLEGVEMLEDDVQFIEEFRKLYRKGPYGGTPEWKLCLAILTSCADDLHRPAYVHGNGSRKRIKDQAREWVNSDSEVLFSFRYVCDVLNLSLSCARKVLLSNPRSISKIRHASQRDLHVVAMRERRRTSASQTRCMPEVVLLE